MKYLKTIAILAVIALGLIEFQRYTYYKGFVAGFEDGSFWRHMSDGANSLADSCLELDEVYKREYAKTKKPGTGDYESIKSSCDGIRRTANSEIGPRAPFKWIPGFR